MSPARIRILIVDDHEVVREGLLTPREKEVLGLMVEGLSNMEIGARLGLSEGTVKGYINVLFRKLGVQARTQAVKLALEQGIVRGTGR